MQIFMSLTTPVKKYYHYNQVGQPNFTRGKLMRRTPFAEENVIPLLTVALSLFHPDGWIRHEEFVAALFAVSPWRDMAREELERELDWVYIYGVLIRFLERRPGNYTFFWRISEVSATKYQLALPPDRLGILSGSSSCQVTAIPSMEDSAANTVSVHTPELHVLVQRVRTMLQQKKLCRAHLLAGVRAYEALGGEDFFCLPLYDMLPSSCRVYRRAMVRAGIVVELNTPKRARFHWAVDPRRVVAAIY
jgi:hypothetical protein